VCGTRFAKFALNALIAPGRSNNCKAIPSLQQFCSLEPSAPELIIMRNILRSFSMDWNRVEGNWKQVKGKVKEQWGKLTDDDLNVIEGHRDQLEGKIQERYGIAKDQVRKDIDSWYNAQRW
jgi:uncharacterized protein YjbJ (UPF0337 family)